jgi:hypothetical protein
MAQCMAEVNHACHRAKAMRDLVKNFTTYTPATLPWTPSP